MGEGITCHYLNKTSAPKFKKLNRKYSIERVNYREEGMILCCCQPILIIFKELSMQIQEYAIPALECESYFCEK